MAAVQVAPPGRPPVEDGEAAAVRIDGPNAPAAALAFSAAVDDGDAVLAPQSEESVLEALLLPSRIAALNTCDAALIRYAPQQFFRLALDPRGRNTRVMAWPLVIIVAWNVTFGIILGPREAAGLDLAGDLAGAIQAIENSLGHLLTAVSLLLVFRLARAAVRYWDARAAAGLMVANCRLLASQAAVYLQRVPQARAEVFRLCAVFPIAVKNYLRPLDGSVDRSGELIPLLSRGEAAAVLSSACPPLRVLTQLRATVAAACPLRPADALSPFIFREVMKSVDVLVDAFGTMERINSTPLPYMFVAHLRTFLTLYLLLVPLPVLLEWGLPAVPAIVAMSWAILGIEAAAVEGEAPFQRRPNHLPLGRFCSVVAHNVVQTARDAPLPTSLARATAAHAGPRAGETSQGTSPTALGPPGARSGTVH